MIYLKLIYVCRSESSSTNLDESRRIKSLITDLKDELDDSQSGIDNRLESMESNMTNLQTRLTQIETRFDRWTTDVKQVISLIEYHSYHCTYF